MVCFVGSVEVSEKFWAWLTDRLGDVCVSCPSSCVDVRKEIVNGMSLLYMFIFCNYKYLGISIALLELMYQSDEYNQNMEVCVCARMRACNYARIIYFIGCCGLSEVFDIE